MIARAGGGMRERIALEVRAADRARLEGDSSQTGKAQKHIWRARVVLLTADGPGSGEIMRRVGTSKGGCGAGGSG